MRNHAVSMCLFVSAFAMLPPAAAPAQDQSPWVETNISPLQVQSLGATPGHVNHVFHTQSANIYTSMMYYTLRYSACVDKAHNGKVVPLEGYIGMPEPSAANWYHGGFLFIILNGKDIGTTPLSSMLLSERGSRGIIDMVWHCETADVRARFLGLPQHDNLYCEIAIEPKQEIKSVELQLRCYPSFFTAAAHREGARRIRTPATLIEQGKQVSLPTSDNWWAVYYDEVFDVAKGEGDGPCALLLPPEEAREIAFNAGSYGVDTRIAYPAQTRKIRLALWDFKGKTNAAALAGMAAGAQKARQELAGLDFTPALVKNIDIAGLRASVHHGLNSPAASKSLATKLTAAQKWLNEDGPKLEGKGRVRGIAAEERLLQSGDKYGKLSVEISLAELLESL
jgi:hypothetical protein